MDKEILQAYKRVGKDYIKSNDNYTAEEIDDFIESYLAKGAFSMWAGRQPGLGSFRRGGF